MSVRDGAQRQRSVPRCSALVPEHTDDQLLDTELPHRVLRGGLDFRHFTDEVDPTKKEMIFPTE